MAGSNCLPASPHPPVNDGHSRPAPALRPNLLRATVPLAPVTQLFSKALRFGYSGSTDFFNPRQGQPDNFPNHLIGVGDLDI